MNLKTIVLATVCVCLPVFASHPVQESVDKSVEYYLTQMEELKSDAQLLGAINQQFNIDSDLDADDIETLIKLCAKLGNRSLEALAMMRVTVEDMVAWINKNMDSVKPKTKA